MKAGRLVATVSHSLALGAPACQRTKPVSQPVSSYPRDGPTGMDVLDPSPAAASEPSVVDDPPGEPWPIVASDFLALAPADTPYVWANLQPLPAPLLKRLEPWSGPLSDAFNEGLNKSPEQAAKLREVLGGEITATSLRAIGIEPNTTFIVYGLGVAPVARVRLKDGLRFKETIDRLGELAARPAPTAVFHGQEYWYALRDNGRLSVFAVVGSDLVFALLPAGAVQRDLLPLVFGQRVPEQSLASSQRLRNVVADHGLTQHFVAVIDVEALVRTTLGRSPPGLERRVAEAMGVITRKDPDCAEDYTRLARLFPTFVFGFDALSSKRISMSSVLALDSTIAKVLSNTVGPIPGLKADDKQGGLASFGIGVDVPGVRAAIRALSSAVERTPFSCEDNQFLNEIGTQIESSTAIAPPAVDSFTGLGSVLYSFTTKDDPSGLDFVATLGTGDPRALLDAAAALGTELQLGKLARPNKPVALRDVVPMSTGSDAWLAGSRLAYGKRGIGWGVGPKGKRALVATLDARRPNDGTMASLSLDFQRLTHISPEILTEALARARSPQAADLTQAILERLGRIAVRLKFTSAGAELEIDVRVPPAR